MNNYKVDVLCENCKNTVVYYIPKGTTIKEFFGDPKNEKCRTCGCLHGRTEQ
ncbi:hypothetical protein LCGC14_0632610 [marine sediment metagenome]|uniref:Uncharacterized protein n=1 Tax=marine sediment metagenome TaxID=412755 RepID=A0A0F9TMX4_9ZZZZ